MSKNSCGWQASFEFLKYKNKTCTNTHVYIFNIYIYITAQEMFSDVYINVRGDGRGREGGGKALWTALQALKNASSK